MTVVKNLSLIQNDKTTTQKKTKKPTTATTKKWAMQTDKDLSAGAVVIPPDHHIMMQFLSKSISLLHDMNWKKKRSYDIVIMFSL